MRAKKLLAPDFALGRTLIAIRTYLDLAILLFGHPSRITLRLAIVILRVKPKYSMVTTRNLWWLYYIVTVVNRLDLDGDIVECGAWNGGSAAVMGLADIDSNVRQRTRNLWLFDSFQGLPPPSERDPQVAQSSYFTGWCKGSVEASTSILAKVGVPQHAVKIVPGWFSDTLTTTPVHRIAVLHIDADWYDSIMTVLESLYDKVVPGGFVVLDDYGYWSGCDQAVANFFQERGIDNFTVHRTDRWGAYLQKPPLVQGNING